SRRVKCSASSRLLVALCKCGGEKMDPALKEQLTAANQARIALDYDTARPLYERLVAADPQCAEAKHGLGFTLMMGYGEFEEGLALMEQAAELAPENQKIVLDLAKSYAMLGEDEKVRPLLERVIALDPNSREGQEAKNQLQYYA
ncbi:MAG: tetratricopeptide repeat protein, partial [Candidatus Zipacnadales bacterium]